MPRTNHAAHGAAQPEGESDTSTLQLLDLAALGTIGGLTLATTAVSNGRDILGGRRGAGGSGRRSWRGRARRSGKSARGHTVSASLVLA